jgi:hypothetical protein
LIINTNRKSAFYSRNSAKCSFAQQETLELPSFFQRGAMGTRRLPSEIGVIKVAQKIAASRKNPQQFRNFSNIKR